jgi:hypothetical protein
MQTFSSIQMATESLLKTPLQIMATSELVLFLLGQLAKPHLLFLTEQSRAILNPRLLIVLVDKAEAVQALG